MKENYAGTSTQRPCPAIIRLAHRARTPFDDNTGCNQRLPQER